MVAIVKHSDYTSQLEFFLTSRVAAPAPAPTPTTAPEIPPKPSSAPPNVEPLAPSRYKVQFTASGELREKLERLQELMQAELAEVIEAAVTEKIERLEGKKYAQTKTPRKSLQQTDTSPKSRYVPAAVKRAVRKRDGGQCRFLSEQGRRCTERRGLELHHHNPFGRGGDHRRENLSLMCRQHNAYLAEREYGKDVFARYRSNGDRVSETSPVYGVVEEYCA
jgi:5-methylcytosine-specific restriction endonuclease McrA